MDCRSRKLEISKHDWHLRDKQTHDWRLFKHLAVGTAKRSHLYWLEPGTPTLTVDMGGGCLLVLSVE